MQRIGFVVFPGFQVMGFAVISAFEFANVHLGEQVYDVQLLSETGGPIPASMGMSVMAKPFGDTKFDTLIIGGGTEIEPSTPGLIEFVRQAWGETGGSPQPVPVRSSWPKRACSTDGVRPRIGSTRAICRRGFQR